MTCCTQTSFVARCFSGCLLKKGLHDPAGSEEHEFIREDLAAVDRSITPWLVVGGHRPFYIDSTSTHAPDGDQPVADDLRSALEDLFLRFSVDLTWHGHHHSYQRTCPVFQSSCQEHLGGELVKARAMARLP